MNIVLNDINLNSMDIRNGPDHNSGGKLKTVMGFLLLVVKQMSFCSPKVS